LLPLVEAWIKNARRCGIKIPIIGGGGILCKKDAAIIKLAGADAISIGTAAMLRPWRVQGIIDYANKIYIS
jgi:dihydroorotate dehydrogenase